VTALAVVAGVGLLGGAGAIARFLLDGAVSSRLGSAFPYGTLAVNLTGAFALGMLNGAGTGRRPAPGRLIGAYTTFSTWTLESHRLGEDGRVHLGAVNLLISLALGLACAWLGDRIGARL
jgi:fluoride exporter